ncbi:hypothetical protein [Streptomyces sp. NBRC 110028]|uniref:hypothetical protein n=1 Tax=Streptomyces sp. NBRC 110028 TaxID=1621260 RepID=UPI000A84F17F|nr:hypothetical protein [Streptomyces sp. NBRC 110028]
MVQHGEWVPDVGGDLYGVLPGLQIVRYPDLDTKKADNTSDESKPGAEEHPCQIVR